MNAIRQSLGLLIGRRPPALQVGAVCRCTRTGDVVLITSRGTGRWVIPKGWPMEGKSLPAAAATEAWEEAGVEGRVQDAELGRYRYDKEQDRGFSVPIEVRVFLLEADRQRADFPEAKQRKRRWFAPADAARLVAERGLREILLALPPIPG
ncbi:NUDIX domain protein [Paracoccus haematequi]|uniref:NUDIX domain protein n=1 Tax=Paracoccus haematequi TaxID=2491866 RepID=A0A447ILB4_9RHOB|nr:NUDIX hydrolase [Paracoccus haematequi]VDS08250.1 NUDIX domain protein [Paracoccus haematequi]